MSNLTRHAFFLGALLLCVVLISGDNQALQSALAQESALTGQLLVATESVYPPS